MITHHPLTNKLQVDAHNIVPCWVASDKQEVGARTIRKKITDKLGEFLTEFPPLIQHPYPCKDLPKVTFPTFRQRRIGIIPICAGSRLAGRGGFIRSGSDDWWGWLDRSWNWSWAARAVALLQRTTRAVRWQAQRPKRESVEQPVAVVALRPDIGATLRTLRAAVQIEASKVGRIVRRRNCHPQRTVRQFLLLQPRVR